MICGSCKTAGELNQRGLYHVECGEIKAAETKFTQSEFFHDECKGCDCQHTTRLKVS
jgi:hypothetical protein